MGASFPQRLEDIVLRYTSHLESENVESVLFTNHEFLKELRRHRTLHERDLETASGFSTLPTEVGEPGQLHGLLQPVFLRAGWQLDQTSSTRLRLTRSFEKSVPEAAPTPRPDGLRQKMLEEDLESVPYMAYEYGIFGDEDTWYFRLLSYNSVRLPLEDFLRMQDTLARRFGVPKLIRSEHTYQHIPPRAKERGWEFIHGVLRDVFQEFGREPWPLHQDVVR